MFFRSPITLANRDNDLCLSDIFSGQRGFEVFDEFLCIHVSLRGEGSIMIPPFSTGTMAGKVPGRIVARDPEILLGRHGPVPFPHRWSGWLSRGSFHGEPDAVGYKRQAEFS